MIDVVVLLRCHYSDSSTIADGLRSDVTARSDRVSSVSGE